MSNSQKRNNNRSKNTYSEKQVILFSYHLQKEPGNRALFWYIHPINTPHELLDDTILSSEPSSSTFFEELPSAEPAESNDEPDPF